MFSEKELLTQSEKMLNYIFRSELKLKILTALTEPKTVRELTDEIYKELSAKYKRKRRGAMHSAVKALKSSDMVSEDEKGNVLTVFGKIFRNSVIELAELVNTFRKHPDFWLTHNIDVIPQSFLNELHVLAESELQYSKSDPYLSRKIILEHIKNAEKELSCITPVIELEWSLAYLDKADAGLDVKTVVDHAMFKKLTEEKGFKEYNPRRHQRPNYELRELEVVPFAMLITEKVLILALPKLEEPTPDMFKVLVSHNSDAINWAKRLYMHMYEKTKPVTVPIR